MKKFHTIRTLLIGTLITISSATHADLVMHLEFEGDLLDSTTFNNDAVVGNSGQFISLEPNGRIGGALEIQGGNTSAPPWIEVADSMSLSPGAEITMAAWVFKTGQLGNNAGIFFKGALVGQQPDWQLTLDDGVSGAGPNSGSATINGCGGGCVEALVLAPPGAEGVPNNAWAHFAATYDGQVLRLYLDGLPVGADEHVAAIMQTGSPLYIGNRYRVSGDIGGFQGLLDDLRIYDNALSAAEMWELALNDDDDGVPASQDNCFTRFNPSQIDSDGDGYGNACDADLNDDCIVNAEDLGEFRARFFTSDPDADFNGDGIVNAIDLGLLRSLFFSAPGPSGLGGGCG